MCVQKVHFNENHPGNIYWPHLRCFWPHLIFIEFQRKIPPRRWFTFAGDTILGQSEKLALLSQSRLNMNVLGLMLITSKPSRGGYF